MTEVYRYVEPPEWMKKHPCTGCGEGYGLCTQGLKHNLKCCNNCEHPSRWEEDPWTSDEYREMWAGQNMPPTAEVSLRKIIKQENNRAYEQEVELAQSILKRNRYSTVPPYEWYGPDPEPTPSTINVHRRLMGLPPADEWVHWCKDIPIPVHVYTKRCANCGKERTEANK